MAGGNGITMRVSAALRAGGMGVIRYSDRLADQGRQGIRVRNDGPGCADISFLYRTASLVRMRADEAEAILIARGFTYHRHETTLGTGEVAISITAYEADKVPSWLTGQKKAAEAPADPEQAAIEASGLQVAKLTQSDWHINHGGRRNAYTIKRTGTGERARYAASAKGRLLDKGMRTLAEALAAVKTDIDTQEA